MRKKFLVALILLSFSMVTTICFAGGKLPDSNNVNKKFELDQKISLIPTETAVGPNGLTITNKGYGHKFGGGPGEDFSYVEVGMKQGEKSENFRIHTPFKGKPIEEWNGWIFTFLDCEDAGPPHSKESKLFLKVNKKQ